MHIQVRSDTHHLLIFHWWELVARHHLAGSGGAWKWDYWWGTFSPSTTALQKGTQTFEGTELSMPHRILCKIYWLNQKIQSSLILNSHLVVGLLRREKKENPSVGSQRGGSGQPQDGLFNCIFPEVNGSSTACSHFRGRSGPWRSS